MIECDVNCSADECMESDSTPGTAKCEVCKDGYSMIGGICTGTCYKVVDGI